MSYDDVRRIERALERALEAVVPADLLHIKTITGSGDRCFEIDILKFVSGRPIPARISISRLAEIMESELS